MTFLSYVTRLTRSRYVVNKAFTFHTPHTCSTSLTKVLQIYSVDPRTFRNTSMGLDIGAKEVMQYVPIVTSVGLTIYVIWQAMRPKIGLVNPNIQKNEEKIVNKMSIEDIGDNIALCRCWRSKKFPVCDGSHNYHNKKMGDNVGPVCISRKGD